MLLQNKRLGKVAVLMGGSSAEREISLLSGAGVLAALIASGVDAYAFDPSQQSVFELKTQQFSRCFVALHGRGGEDGVMQGILDYLGIPYTGSGVMASSIGMDKVMTKRVWSAMGLPTPAWCEVRNVQEAQEAFDRLGPMVIKPAHEGSSIGIAKALQREQCAAAYRDAAMCDSLVLCEALIVGDEVTCPVIGTMGDARALPVIQIVAPEGNYDFENKYYKNDTEYRLPAALPPGEESAIQEIVLRAYHGLHCAGWGRIDVMIDGQTRQPYLLEVNTAPGMTTHSLVPMSAKAAGLSYTDLCLALLHQTLQKDVS